MMVDCNTECPKISVIIPVHNAHDTLSATVNSILGQNYPNLQIILAENGSSDGSWELCRSLQSEHPCVEAVQSDNTGVSCARNAGLGLADGDLVGFCDADDLYLEHCLNTVVSRFAANPECAMVVTGYRNAKRNGELRFQCVDREAVWSFSKLLDHVLTDGRIMGSVCNKFFKRELLQGVAFDPHLELCEDTHFLANVLHRFPKLRAAVTPVCTYEYTENPSSATSSVERLFDGDGNMKYAVALDRILKDFSLKTKTRWLVRRSKYRIAYLCTIRFKVNAEQKDCLCRIQKDNFLYFLMTFYAAPSETVKYLLKQALRMNR